MGNQCHHDTVPLISLYYTDRNDWNYTDCTDWNCTFLNNHTQYICSPSCFLAAHIIINKKLLKCIHFTEGKLKTCQLITQIRDPNCIDCTANIYSFLLCPVSTVVLLYGLHLQSKVEVTVKKL